MRNAININEMEAVGRPLLPVIIVLDSSGSMQGKRICMLNHCMEEVVDILSKFAASNADALMKIGVLKVNSGAQWVQPKGLEEFEDFVYSPLKAGGLTDMGAALTELNNKLSRKNFLISTTGWCRPIIIFMTDGYPTDSWEGPLRELKTNNKWYQFAIKIGFAVGDDADARIISDIVGNPEAVIQTTDLEIFSFLLKKVALKSVMVGSISHPAGEVPNSKEIVQEALKELNDDESAQTAADMGISSTEPEVLEIDSDVDDAWDGVWD